MNHTETKRHIPWFEIAVVILALVLRIIAAGNAYPIPGDAGHFVQHGIALAHGVPDAMSIFWSQGMIVLAAAAEKAGVDPSYFMQGLCVAAGTIVVLVGMLLVGRFFESAWPRRLFGLIAATNPAMIHYSITGYSEIPYMALLISAVYLCLRAVDARGWRSGLLLAAGGLLLAVSGYFKGLDAMVAAFSLCVYLLITGWRRIGVTIGRCAVLAVIYCIVILPLFVLTYEQTGKFGPGSKTANLSVGLDWTDSSEVYNPERVVQNKSAMQIARELPGRIVYNAGNTFREFNGMMFVRGLRVGTVWFMIFSLLVLLAAVLRNPSRVLLMVCMIFFQLSAMSLVFVHARILTPSWMWVLMIMSVGIYELFRMSGKGARRMAALVLVLFLGMNAVYARDIYVQQEFFCWRYENNRKTAERMKAFAKDDDVIMTYGGAFAVEYYAHNPLLLVPFFYAELDVLEKKAQKKNVKYILVSDAYFSHWPIGSVFDPDTKLPDNWKIIDEYTFSENTVSPQSVERIKVIERTQ